MQRLRQLLLVALVVLGVFVVAIPLAWMFDSSRHNGRVTRNVTLAGVDIGGLREPELVRAVAQVGQRYATAPVRIEAPEGGFTTDAKALGLEVAATDTTKQAMEVGRGGNMAARFVGWAKSLVTPRQAPVAVTVRPASVHAAVDAGDKGPREEPVEPTITFEKGNYRAVEGKPGKGIDPADVIEELPDAAANGLPIVVEVDRGAVAPRFRIDEAEALALKAQTVISSPVEVTAGTAKATVPASTMRGWLRAEPTGDVLSLAVDEKKVLADLAKLLPKAGTEPVESSFAVNGDVVEVTPGKPGTTCCDKAAAGIVSQALLSGTKISTRLPLKQVNPEVTAEEAASLGIKENVGTFETKFPAGQLRVKNIHRISDLVRGQVIKPGETFSVNEFVGKRTVANGFVAGGVIEDGKFTEDIGGGISQFATTFFNAAFFGGLDIVEYQSHSIYISRYPRGREATLSFPKPDLKIKNTTPYGVLIWPTYTAGSVRVTLYSTKFVVGEQTGQSSAPKGACTRVTTERTRTYVADGRKVKDSVSALYRPAEGVNC